MAAKVTEAERKLFPLKDVGGVVELFKLHLESNTEPNLAFLSIIIGYIENTLTSLTSRPIPSPDDDVIGEEEEEDVTGGEKGAIDYDGNEDPLKTRLPIINFDDVDALYQRFLAIVRAHVDVTAYGSPKYATRELVKRVSDVVWCTLSSSYYKDRAHLQSIYSYMTGAKLDSSGTTLAVVAALQTLGYHDVHLALSEDHTWVVCGEHGDTTVEVTWHGKGNEDKRGIAVTEEVYCKSWLYVNGRPIVCTRHMEVATIVSNVNPGINATTDSEEVILLQQALLWLLYDSGHLAKYPMAIDNLGDLEEMSSTRGRPLATKLYEEAILSNVRYYGNQHVYPYTYLGGYCYRNRRYKWALKAWAKAAHVIRHYNYSRDDEEIYKEFLEIATELIPYSIRSGSPPVLQTPQNPTSHGSGVLGDPHCFAAILEFYDGICGWEEGSPTPVLHIGWAKALLTSIAKFEPRVRGRVKIEDSGEDAPEMDEGVFGCLSGADDVMGGSGDDAHHDQNGNTPTLMQASATASSTSSCSPPSSSSNKGRGVEEGGCIVGHCPTIFFYSAKMRGLKDLLLGDKLNSQAISLQLSAQSQVTSKKRERGADADHVAFSNVTPTGRSKRSRRDQ